MVAVPAFRLPTRPLRYAGEGGVVFGLTKHGATLPILGGGVNRRVLPIFADGRALVGAL
jgi:hypothetical protein